MSKTLRKLLSLLLCMVMVMGMFPAAALAEDPGAPADDADEPVGAGAPVDPEETTPPSSQGDDTSPYTGEAEIDPEEPVGADALIGPADAPDALPEEPVADDLQDVTDSGACGDNLTWTLENNVLTISGTGDMWNWSDLSGAPWSSTITDIVLPEGLTSIGHYAFQYCSRLTDVMIPDSVTSIGDYAFSGCSSLTSVTIPSSVTSIGSGAFYYCSSLKSVTIPDGVTSIGRYAFSYCSGLTSVTIPSSVTSIGDNAFEGCDRLTSVTIPEGVTSIGNSAFNGCWSLTGVTIPSSVTSIGDEAFSGCSKLTEILVAEGNRSYSSIDGVLYDASGKTLLQCPGGKSSVTIPEGVTSIGDYAFEYCSSLTSVTIPDGVTSIGDHAFSHCSSLTSVTIPDGVTSIGNSAFYNCSSLTSVTILEGVTSIGNSAFYNCSSLTSVTIPSSVTSIGNGAFSGCSSLTDVYYGGTMAAWKQLGMPYDRATVSIHCADGDITADPSRCGENLIWSLDESGTLTISGTGDMWDWSYNSGAPWKDNSGSVKTVVIQSGVTSIGYSAFRDCYSLTSVTIPAGVTSIGDYAFYYCNRLTSVTIPEGVTSIGNYAFYECSSLTSVTIPEGVTSIGDYAFSSCSSLTSVTIPEGVTSIGDNAFSYCSRLTSVTIPASVTSIGNQAFQYCGSLTDVYYGGTMAAWKQLDVSFDSETVSIHCADGDITIDSHGGDNLTWSLESGTLTIAGSGNMLNWSYNSGAPWSNISDSIKTVVIQPGVTSIGNFAFYGCESLTSVTIPEGVTSIGNSAFSGCSSLTSVTIPEGVTTIGNNAFYECSRLTSVTIPEGVTSIGDHAFTFCSRLTSVTIPESVTGIGSYAFHVCDNLEEIAVAENNPCYFSYDGILYMRENTILLRCPGGKNGAVVLYDGTQTIGDGAFRDCNRIISVTIPGSVTKIERWALSDCSVLQEIRFLGSAPEMDEECFSWLNIRYPVATAYYPANDPSWTEDVRQNYGGDITWVAYDSAPAVVASGECGDNLTWTLDGNGALTISGSGEMWELSNTGYPWDPYSEQIQSLALGAEVTLIGSGAFSSCGNIQTISFAGAAPSFGDNCFAGLTASAHYPVGTGTWIPDVRSNYGGAITWVPIMTESGDFPCGDDMTWRIEGTVLSISGTGEMWDYNVVDHFAPWYELDSLNEVDTLVIGEGVTVIGEYAFAQGRCESWIRTASLPSTLLRIKKAAFWQSRISQITFPEGLENIEDEAFMLGSLQGDLIIPSSVKTIGTKAFWYDYLDTVTVSGSIEDIGYLAFGQNNITDITFGNTMERWNEIGKDSGYDVYQTTIHCTDGDLLPATKEQCGEGLSWDFSDGVLTISGTGDMFDFDRHEENGHTVLATPWIEVSDQITGVMIESGVTSIGNNAFCDCANLAWCQIPEGVTRIGWCAFMGCEKLQSITIPESVVAIEDGAFVGTGLRSITIPAGLSALGEGAFSACFYLETVIFLTPEDSGNAGTNTVRLRTTRNTNGLVIGASAFSDCSNLTEVILTDHIVGIGEQAFYNCDSLQSVTIPANVTNVGAGAFAACDALEEILVDEQNTAFRSIDGVLYDIEGETLLACPGRKEGQVVIPESVKTISAMAFLGCSGLTSVTIPESVTSVGSKAFQDCTTMTEIRFEGAAPELGDDAFGNVTATVCYPDNDPSWTEEVLQDYSGTITWVAYEAEEPEHTPGDINGDGKVNTADVTLLAKYVKARGRGVEIVEAAGNVDGSEDGKITTADVALLAKYVKARGNGVVIH